MQVASIEGRNQNRNLVKRKVLKQKPKIKLDQRSLSKEFNDPIYAGLESLDDNHETNFWGPWINNNFTPIRANTSLKAIPVQRSQENISKVHFSIRQPRVSLDSQMQASPSQELPMIKERSSSTLKQIEIKSISSNQQNSLPWKRRKNNFHIKSLSKLDRRPLLFHEQKLGKVGTVVYNYCTQNQGDECLLNYGKLLEKRGTFTSNMFAKENKEKKGPLQKTKPIQNLFQESKRLY